MIDVLVLCGLLSAGDYNATAACINNANSNNPQSHSIRLQAGGTQEVKANSQNRPFMAQDRIEVDAPETTMSVAEPTYLKIHVKWPTAVSIVTSQRSEASESQADHHDVHYSERTSQLVQRDGETYLEVVPLELGRIRFQIFAKFADGGFVIKFVTVDVLPPSQNATKLIVGEDGLGTHGDSVIYVRHDTIGGQRHWKLSIGAQYPGVEKPIDIAPRFALFKIRDDGRPPVVEIDSKTGAFTTLSVGHSLLETTYGGITDLTCIVVESPASMTSDRSNCRDLLLPGEKLSR